MRAKACGLMIFIIILVCVNISPGKTWREKLAQTNLELFEKPARANEMRLVDTEGRPVSLAALKGKLTLLNFWRIDCVPCVMETAILEKLYPKLKGKGVEVVAVNLEDPFHNVIQYAKKQGYRFKVAYDPDGRYKIQTRESELSDITAFVLNPMQKAIYETPSAPTTYIISPQGRIIGRAVGMVNWGEPPFIDFIKWLAPGTGAPDEPLKGRGLEESNNPTTADNSNPGAGKDSSGQSPNHGNGITEPIYRSYGARRLLAQAPATNRPRGMGAPDRLPPARPAPQTGAAEPLPQTGPRQSSKDPESAGSAHRLIPLPKALPYTPPGAATAPGPEKTPEKKKRPAQARIKPDEDGYVMATIPGSEPKPLKPGAGYGAGDSPAANRLERFLLDAFEEPSLQRSSPVRGPVAKDGRDQTNSPLDSITSGLRSVLSTFNPFQ